jgi:cytochrome c5
MKRSLSSILGLAALAAAGCSAPAPAGPAEAPKVTVVEGAPASGKVAAKTAITTADPAKLLSVLHGAVAAGTDHGLLQGSLPAGDLAGVPAYDDQGDIAPTGAIHLLARRSGGRILALGDDGLFGDEEGLLLRSPLTDALKGMDVRAIDALGEDADEELWITTASSAVHVAGGSAHNFSIGGVSAAPDAVVGAGAYLCVVAAGGGAYLVDLAAGHATPIATGLGAVHGFDRGDDGAVYLATDGGLLERARDGSVSLRTFADHGQPAVPALAVAASYGSVLVTTAADLLSVDATGSTKVGDVTGAVARGLAADADGDAWVIDASGLSRYETGSPVSFAKDVAPFMTAHCASCHAGGTQGAPKHDFTDYATAKGLADTLVKKLEAPAGMGVMPPTEKLTAADYAVVTRWVAGGAAP